MLRRLPGLSLSLPLSLALTLVACKEARRDEEPANPLAGVFHDDTVLVDDQPGPAGIALDATHIYWTHVGKPLVRRMPRAGGAIETLYEGTGELGGHWLAVVGSHVYFSEGFTLQRIGTTIGGGPLTTVGTVPQLPARFAADSHGAYSASSSVIHHAVNGSDTRLGGGGELWDVTTDVTHVYWLDRDGIYRAAKPIAGAAPGAPQQLARGVFRWGRIAVSDTDVYWGDAVLEAIFAVPKAGGIPRFVAHGWNIATRKLVVDGPRLWVLQSGGTLEHIDLATGQRTPTAVGLQRGGSADHFYDIAVTAETIFVAAGGQSLVGAGPVHIDLTQPDPTLPTYTYDGAIVSVPASLPPRADRHPAGELYIAGVGFVPSTSEPNDANNATRWIADITSAYPAIGTGGVAIHVIASAKDLAEPLARTRAENVAARIRAQLPDAMLLVELDPTNAQNTVRIVLDEVQLMTHLGPR